MAAAAQHQHAQGRERICADGHPFDGICFGGGSLQTFCYLKEISAIERVIEARLNTHIKHFAGSSAGCLFAISIAAGLTSHVIAETMVPVMDSLFKPSLANIWRHMGLDDASCMEAALRKAMKNHDIDMDMTISQFEEKHSIHLYLYAVDAEIQTGMFMPGHCTLMQAFRCSSAIPLLYVPYWFEDKLYIDGSFLNCYIPHILPADMNWYWMRVQQVIPQPPHTIEHVFTPRNASMEKYIEIVLGVVRSPAEVVIEMPDTVCVRNIAADARVPFLIPRMNKASFDAMFADLFLVKNQVDYTLEKTQKN